MIYDAIRMAGYDGAAPAGNGSDTDGVAVKAVGLPMSVMSLHVHLLISDHSEMASYIDGCLSCFFALFARALVKRYFNGDDFHINELIRYLRAESGLPVVLHPVRISLNETEHLRGSKCSV